MPLALQKVSGYCLCHLFNPTDQAFISADSELLLLVAPFEVLAKLTLVLQDVSCCGFQHNFKATDKPAFGSAVSELLPSLAPLPALTKPTLGFTGCG